MSAEIIKLHTQRPADTTEADYITFISCKACRNKCYVLIEESRPDMLYPLVKCAACGAAIGRIGWLSGEE